MGEESVDQGVEFVPVSSITPDGKFLIISLAKWWTDRKGRRGAIDPSGGLTFQPAYNAEILIAFPLDDDKEAKPPEGTLTIAQFESVLKKSADINSRMIGMEPPKDF